MMKHIIEGEGKGEVDFNPFKNIDTSNAIVLKGDEMKPGDLEKILDEAEESTLIIIEDIDKLVRLPKK